MKRKRLFHTTAMLATSFAAFGPGAAAKEMKEGKKVRPSTAAAGAARSAAAGKSTPPPRLPADKPRPLDSALITPLGDSNLFLNSRSAAQPASRPSDIHGLQAGKYPWRMNIVTTTFWVGESAARNNPVANYASSWDPTWSKSYGGLDTPVREQRVNFLPVAFTPQQNPFYIALPYNDVSKGAHKPEAAAVVPWFQQDFRQAGKTVLKDRWVAIHFNGRVAYAQWEDCGPFRTDHSAYVFGTERPKPNLNKGAGLDVSPAVRDFLGMRDTDVTDWRFVEFSEVPQGPWATHGNNNTFVQRKQDRDKPVVLIDQVRPAAR